MVTDRMLRMFRKKRAPGTEPDADGPARGEEAR
jgi:hypothetical protein